MPHRQLFALLGGLILGAPALAMSPPEKLSGTAYDLDSGEFLYLEEHQFRYDEEGQLLGDSVRYLDAEGALIGSKEVDYRRSVFLPEFLTTVNITGYQEGMRYEGDKLVLRRRANADAKMEEKSLDLDRCDAIDAGFHPLVQMRFEDILAGDTIRFRFCAAGSLVSVGFKAKRLEDGEIQGQRTVRVRIEISGFLSFFVDPLILSYNPLNRDLIRYEGVSNVRDAEGDTYNIRMDYPLREGPYIPPTKASLPGKE